MLYVMTLYVEGASNAIRAHGGTVSHFGLESICALFGLEGGSQRAAQRALQATGAIEGVISDLNNRLGRQHDRKLKISVSIHAGRAAVGEIGSGEAPMVVAIGGAIDAANALRKAAAENDMPFAISEAVYRDAGLTVPAGEKLMIQAPGSDAFAAFLSDAAPVPSPTWTLHGEIGRRTVLRRLWTG